MRKTQLLLLIITFVVAIFSMACTEKIRARQWGGTSNIVLPPGQKLIVATWKDSDFWYLVRPMHPEETAETYEFAESSAFGILNGKIVIRERAAK